MAKRNECKSKSKRKTIITKSMLIYKQQTLPLYTVSKDSDVASIFETAVGYQNSHFLQRLLFIIMIVEEKYLDVL